MLPISRPTPSQLNPIYDDLIKNYSLHRHFIPRELINKEYEIGSGHFGKVFKGTYVYIKIPKIAENPLINCKFTVISNLAKFFIMFYR